jgi:hypothetical protein
MTRMGKPLLLWRPSVGLPPSLLRMPRPVCRIVLARSDRLWAEHHDVSRLTSAFHAVHCLEEPS